MTKPFFLERLFLMGDEMELRELIDARTCNAFKKKGYETVEDVARLFPRKYYDFTSVKKLDQTQGSETGAYLCSFESYEKKKINGRTIVKAVVRENQSGYKIYISWFGQYQMYRCLQSAYRPGEEVFVCGSISYHEEYNSYFITNPVIFKHFETSDQRIYTVYPNYRGISEERMKNVIRMCLDHMEKEETMPEDIRTKYHLLTEKEAVLKLHYPERPEDIERAKRRLIADDLLYFSAKLEKNARELPVGSPFGIKTKRITTEILQSLPYELTTDQKGTLESMIDTMRDGKRISALIQGDVGCGKTIIAFLMMFLMADSGYQSVLFAPIGTLARQHYLELCEMAKPYGIQVEFLHGQMKAKEKKEALKRIASGESQMIVGTHSVFQASVNYQNLGLCIVDEEHKFGVLQRESILKKAANGMHYIQMSATPIPRTLAALAFSNTQIYNILSMPAGRKPVKTTIFNKEKGIFRFLENELATGRQGYVICAQIDETDGDNKREDILSVTECYERYQSFFDGRYQVEMLTGKMSSEETAAIIARFKSNETQILISTTVVEVGVNVPNASTIVINNAENFGIANLHQLRGRVGRGFDQGYCILNSVDMENERLQTLCKYQSGFDIAEADLKLRGSGNLLGTEQSGSNRLVETAMKYPNTFKEVKKMAAGYIDGGIIDPFLGQYERANASCIS